MNQKPNSGRAKLYRRFSITSLTAVYLLILAGGIVRSTGSGMGCPDWPKCFGQLVPPTEVSQLPDNYKEIYSAKREAKNERFAKYLSVLGFSETADRILNDESILVEADFNVYKTWTEYVNRLLGALVGIFILGMFVSSIRLLKERKRPFWISLAALITVIFEGWIGSIVVSTNLVPWTITLHMLLALLVVGLLTFAVFDSGKHESMASLAIPTGFKRLLVLGMTLMVIQIALGTQVREAIDAIAIELGNANRNQWINELGLGFYIHRTFSLVIIGVHAYLFMKVYKSPSTNREVFLLSGGILLALVITTLSGGVMAYFAIPAFIQPLHLTLSSLIFGLQVLLFLDVYFSKKEVTDTKLTFAS
jgi:cytochrome c oxidase assembly protein subunit 15